MRIILVAFRHPLTTSLTLTPTPPRRTKLSYAEQSQALAGPMALLKYYLARCGREISDDAVQIWGGRGITQGGMGRLIEQHQRTFHFDTLLGGADEGEFLFVLCWLVRKGRSSSGLSSLRSSRGPRSAAGFEADASGELVDHDAFLATTAGFPLRFSGPRTLTVRSPDPVFFALFKRYKCFYLTSDQSRDNDCVLELVLLTRQQKRSFPSRGPCAINGEHSVTTNPYCWPNLL